MEKAPKSPLVTEPGLQALIHRLEVGGGSSFLKWLLLGLAVVALIVGYDWRGYKNLNTQEAMDAAQLARNLAEGQGYSTLFIRPLSIYLITNHAGVSSFTAPDPAKLKGMHPDLANPPVYPLILAGLMKVLPFPFEIPGAGAAGTGKAPNYFWNKNDAFWWYPPDFIIASFNQLLFLGVVAMTFLLARKLFDVRVAWLSAGLLLGTELLWRFTVSGLSTILLMLIFLGVAWCLVWLEEAARLRPETHPAQLRYAALAGLLVGVGALTRYAFGWLILPVTVSVVWFSVGTRRAVNALAAVMIFAAVLTPWVVRNYRVCGQPFGTATFTVMESTGAFQEYRLQRALRPDFSKYNIGFFWQKLLLNTRGLVSNDLPKLGGNWTSAFFLAGLLLAFKSPAIRRLRYFVLLALLALAVAQALGRTQLADDIPETNTENLLVLLTPLIIIFGVSLFFVLLDQLELPVPELRFGIIAGFGAVICLPMILIFLPPKTYPIAYPPYYPPIIQQVCNWMKPGDADSSGDLMMSDVPWAVAWYGHRQCAWLTLDAQRQFMALNDDLKPVRALYLTPRSTDGRLLTQWVRSGELSWGTLVLAAVVRGEVPPEFPLRKAPAGFLPEQIFLTDQERWLWPTK